KELMYQDNIRRPVSNKVIHQDNARINTDNLISLLNNKNSIANKRWTYADRSRLTLIGTFETDFMAIDQTKRLKQRDLVKDKISNDALKAVGGYAPSNPQYTVANLKTLYESMTAAQASETQASAALRTARDKVVKAEWNFHNAVMNAKDQV